MLMRVRSKRQHPACYSPIALLAPISPPRPSEIRTISILKPGRIIPSFFFSCMNPLHQPRQPHWFPRFEAAESISDSPHSAEWGRCPGRDTYKDEAARLKHCRRPSGSENWWMGGLSVLFDWTSDIRRIVWFGEASIPWEMMSEGYSSRWVYIYI